MYSYVAGLLLDQSGRRRCSNLYILYISIYKIRIPIDSRVLDDGDDDDDDDDSNNNNNNNNNIKYGGMFWAQCVCVIKSKDITML
jgi:hypothetical protein